MPVPGPLLKQDSTIELGKPQMQGVLRVHCTKHFQRNCRRQWTLRGNEVDTSPKQTDATGDVAWEGTWDAAPPAKLI